MRDKRGKNQRGKNQRKSPRFNTQTHVELETETKVPKKLFTKTKTVTKTVKLTDLLGAIDQKAEKEKKVIEEERKKVALTVDEEETSTDSEVYKEKEQKRRKIEETVRKENVAFIQQFIERNQKIVSKQDEHEFFNDFKKNNDIFDGLKKDYFCPGNIHLDDEGEDKFCLKVITGLSKVFTRKIFKRDRSGHPQRDIKDIFIAKACKVEGLSHVKLGYDQIMSMH